MSSTKVVIRKGTRVINQYTFSPYCGSHGTVIQPFKMKGWSSVFARVKDDLTGHEYSELKQYLIREDSE